MEIKILFDCITFTGISLLFHLICLETVYVFHDIPLKIHLCWSLFAHFVSYFSCLLHGKKYSSN